MVPLIIMFSQTSFSESYYLFNYLKQTSIVFFSRSAAAIDLILRVNIIV